MNKVKEFALGRIEYRTLTVPGRLRLLARLGISTDAKSIDRMAKTNELELVANIIEAMETQIVSIEAKKGDVVIDSFQDSLHHDEFMGPYSEIATELLGELAASVAGGEEKKPKALRRKSGRKKGS